MFKIPHHLKDKVTDYWKDDDGYWVILKKGWHFEDMECHTAHEWTLKDIRHSMRKDNVIPVENDWD